jgi:hypothetical protein
MLNVPMVCFGIEMIEVNALNVTAMNRATAMNVPLGLNAQLTWNKPNLEKQFTSKFFLWLTLWSDFLRTPQADKIRIYIIIWLRLYVLTVHVPFTTKSAVLDTSILNA